MSVVASADPTCSTPAATPSIATVIDSRQRDLGGFQVRRLLPSIGRRLVGPFIFFDHMGPRQLAPGTGIDVRPHPHIGLATVTYLFEGEIVHRDSLGSEQVIRPGDINWMTAGRGIVHSERTSPELRESGSRLEGLQIWVALPLAAEETAPQFHHHPSSTLPTFEREGASLRVLAGAAYGHTSPVNTFSPLFYVDVALPNGCTLEIPSEYAERAAYVVSGNIRTGDEHAASGRMLVFTEEAHVRLHAETDSRIVLLGGAPLEGERHIDWNFVSSTKGRLEQAKKAWADGLFPKVPGDELEFIPLPK